MSDFTKEKKSEGLTDKTKQYLFRILVWPGVGGGILGFFAGLWGNAKFMHYIFWSSAFGSESTGHIFDMMTTLSVDVLKGIVLGIMVAYGAVLVIAVGVSVDVLRKEREEVFK